MLVDVPLSLSLIKDVRKHLPSCRLSATNLCRCIFIQIHLFGLDEIVFIEYSEKYLNTYVIRFTSVQLKLFNGILVVSFTSIVIVKRNETKKCVGNILKFIYDWKVCWRDSSMNGVPENQLNISNACNV